jgi:hypothetical protein
VIHGTVRITTSRVRPGVRKLSCSCRWQGRASSHEEAVATAETHSQTEECARRRGVFLAAPVSPKAPRVDLTADVDVPLPRRQADVPAVVFTSASPS